MTAVTTADYGHLGFPRNDFLRDFGRIPWPKTTTTRHLGNVRLSPTSRAASDLQDIPWPTSPRHQMIARLESLRNRSADERWPGAIWPSDKAFDAARSFIESLPERLSAVADIGLADDGEINFLWKTESVHVDLGFHDEGSCSYFARDRVGREFLVDDFVSNEGLPPEIANLLTV